MGDRSRYVDLRRLLFCTALTLLVAACSGAGQKKILGAPAIGTPPTVIATLPAATAPVTDGIVTDCAPPPPGTTTSFATARQALVDANAAYLYLAGLPPGGNPDPKAGELGGLTLAPGVYKSASGTFKVSSGDLTLDAKGDPNAVWVFKMASSLTVGSATPRKVILINGAQAQNVFWQVGSSATINVGSVMAGNIIAKAAVTISTAGTGIQSILTGRALSLVASVTMVNTTIVAP